MRSLAFYKTKFIAVCVLSAFFSGSALSQTTFNGTSIDSVQFVERETGSDGLFIDVSFSGNSTCSTLHFRASVDAGALPAEAKLGIDKVRLIYTSLVTAMLSNASVDFLNVNAPNTNCIIQLEFNNDIRINLAANKEITINLRP